MKRALMTSRRLGHADFIHLAARPVRLVVDLGTLWVTQDREPEEASRSTLAASSTSTATPD